MATQLPLLALPVAPTGDRDGLTIREKEMLARSVLLGELNRLKGDNEVPPGAPEGGKWRIVKVVGRFKYVEDAVVWVVRTDDGSEEAYNESGEPVKIAGPEDQKESDRRGRWICVGFLCCMLLLAGGGFTAIFVVANSNKDRVDATIEERFPR